MHTQTGTFQTPKASKYLQQLCKHFAHKIEVSFTETEGTAHFIFGPATLLANDDALTVTVSGPDDAALEQARHVIDIHLQRFAFREDFETLDWAEAV